MILALVPGFVGGPQCWPSLDSNGKAEGWDGWCQIPSHLHPMLELELSLQAGLSGMRSHVHYIYAILQLCVCEGPAKSSWRLHIMKNCVFQMLHYKFVMEAAQIRLEDAPVDTFLRLPPFLTAYVTKKIQKKNH